jgi:uncharacterized membrane protein YhaH (DUF805 family)
VVQTSQALFPWGLAGWTGTGKRSSFMKTENILATKKAAKAVSESRLFSNFHTGGNMNQELQYLRDELNQRITYSYERSHKVLGHLLLLWGGTLALFNMSGNISGKNFMEDIFLFFIVSTIFFISVVVIWIFSKRELENWKQVLKIAAYNVVFYEKIPCAKDEDKFYWELATYKIMIKEKEKSDYTKTSNHIRSHEYFIFSLIATIMSFFLLLLFFLKFSETLSIACPDILMISLCFSYIACSVILSILTYKNTNFSLKKSFKEKKEQMKSFIEYAKETEYETEDEIRKRLGEDIWNEVYDLKRSLP